jgi:hypothetical protein
VSILPHNNETFTRRPRPGQTRRPRTWRHERSGVTLTCSPAPPTRQAALPRALAVPALGHTPVMATSPHALI